MDRLDGGGGESAECLTSARGSMAVEEEQEVRLCGTRLTGETLDPLPAVQVRHLTASATLSDKEVIKESRHDEEEQRRRGSRDRGTGHKRRGRRGKSVHYQPASASRI